MFLLSFLIFSSYSSITSLNDQNYLEIINRKGKIPLFLKVWSPWCSHCQLLAPSFQQLADMEEFNSTVEFGELNCDAFPSPCKKIAENKVPTFYFYDSELEENIRYSNDYSMDGFITFLKKQLSKNLMNITNEIERAEVISSSDYSVSYIFTLPLNDPTLGLVSNLSNIYKGTNKRFYIESNSSVTEKSLVAYISHNHFVRYDGNWADSSIKDFIFENYFPLIVNIGSEVLLLSMFLGKKIVLIGYTDKNTRNEINNWNLDHIPNIQYCTDYLLTETTSAYKYSFDLLDKKPFIALIDYHKRVAWRNESFEFNKEGVDKLINLSLTDKKLKYSFGVGSPNNSIFQKIKYYYMTRYNQDWTLYIFLTAILMLVGVLMIILIVACFKTFQKPSKNIKQEPNKKNE